MILADTLFDVNWPYYLESLIKLLVAGLLGAMIGMEREYRGREAGLRTQLLVAVGSALVMIVSLHFATVYEHSTSPVIRIDPARVAYGVMTGVGFLGAGVMIRFGISVRGLTTAASLWCTAAVGLAVGFGMYPAAISAALIVLLALFGLAKVEKHLPSRQYKSITIIASSSAGVTIDMLSNALRARNVKIIDVDYAHNFANGQEQFTLHVALLARAEANDVLTITDDLPELIRMNIQ
jgi:putative Mg2+ transporter-C (MgtC) family protein